MPQRSRPKKTPARKTETTFAGRLSQKREARRQSAWKLLGRSFLSVLPPLALGLLGFTLVIGWSLANPANYYWIISGDFATGHLGWCFYRHTPWSFPMVMANPNCGLELSSTVMFTDSPMVPCFLGKLFRDSLPDPCQLMGLWLLVGFLLQSWFAWKLVGLLTEDIWSRLPAAGLLVFAPPFLWRTHIHFSLACAHWAIIAAVYLTFSPNPTRPNKSWAWAFLVAIGALLHAYIFAMITALWVADVARRYFYEGQKALWLLGETAGVLALTLLVMWQEGIFMVGPSGWSGGGFGYFRNNLLSLINPQAWSPWSYVIPGLPYNMGEPFEGFNYLGGGGLLLILLSLPFLYHALRYFSFPKQYYPLLVALVLLTLFSFSNRISIGSFITSDWLLPEPYNRWANIFRSSGRMFWPTYYVVFFLLIRSVVRNYGREWAAWLFLTAFFIQVVDTSAGWLPETRGLAQSKTDLVKIIQAPFWKSDFTGYHKLRLVPPQSLDSAVMMAFSYFCLQHGMGTDAVYFSRTDGQRIDKLAAEDQAVLHSNALDPETIYILNPEVGAEARTLINHARDRYFQIDSFFIILPGAKLSHRDIRLNRDAIEF